VYVVALTQLATSPEGEAAALAADIGAIEYQARLLLLSAMPVVVRSTPDEASALELLYRLRARGHGAVALDATRVVASSATPSMRRFRLEADAILLDDQPEARLPYDDVLAFVAAVHRRHGERTSQRPDPVRTAFRAMATRWPVLLRSVTQETERSEDREEVLYLFRRNDAAPWILREHGTSWAGLGQPIERTESANFWRTVDALRERAPLAVYDDRLIHRHMPEENPVFVGETTIRTSSESIVDLLAHILALWLTSSDGARDETHG
jgi:hypothetical protein